MFDFRIQGQGQFFFTCISIKSKICRIHQQQPRTNISFHPVIASRRLSMSNRSKNIRFPVYVRFPYTSNGERLSKQSLDLKWKFVKGNARTQERTTPREWGIQRKGRQRFVQTLAFREQTHVARALIPGLRLTSVNRSGVT